MPSLSSNATTYRAGRYSFTGWLSVLPQTVILTGTVSATPSSYPVLTISYTTVSGSYSNVKTGMTVILKSSGGTQKALLRVATGGTITNVSLPVNEVSQGVADIQSGDSITVVDEWRIWDKLSAASAALDKDSRIAYSDQGDNPNPVTNSGGAVAGFNTSVTFDGSTSYVIDPDSSSITHSWALVDGTPSTSSSASPTVTFPVGFRWVSHTVTDSTNSKTTTQRVPVWVHGTGFMPLSVIVDSLSGNVDSGWRCTFKVPFGTEASLTSLPDGAMVVYHEQEYYANTENSYGSLVSGRSNVKFVGYLVSDSIHIDPDGDEVTFEAVSPLSILEQTPALPQLMVSATSASKWSELKTLTTKKMFWYLANWGSNVLDAFDLVWNDGIDLSYERIAVEGATIAEQLRDIANSLNLQVTCDRLGRILFTRDPAFLTSIQRSSRTKLYDLTTADIMEIDLTRQHRYQVKTVRGEGITSANAPVFSNAPGNAPASLGTGSDTLAKQIVSSQSQLNDRTGYHFAKINGLYNGLIVPKGARLKVPMGYDWFDPAYREFVTIALSSDTNGREVAFTSATKWTVEAVDISYDVEAGSKDITVTLDHETIGVAGVTYIPPQEGDNGLPDLPDIVVDLPVTGFDPGTGYGIDPGAVSDGGVTSSSTKTMAVFCTDNKMYLTANFSHPEASGGPTWTATDLTAISGWGGGTLVAFEVDPYSPSYLGTGSQVNGWIVTTTKVQKISDIFGTPALGTASSFTYTSSTRTMAVDRGVQNFVIVASWCATHGVYAMVTTDGSTWAETQVRSYENTAASGISPGVWISPHTAGKAYISVWTATGDNSTATTGFYKTSNYGSSWSALTSPTVNSGVDVSSIIAIPFSNTAATTLFHRKKASGGGLSLMRNVSGSETDVTPSSASLSYVPLGQYGHEAAPSDTNANKLAIIGGAGLIGITSNTDDFTASNGGWINAPEADYTEGTYVGSTGWRTTYGHELTYDNRGIAIKKTGLGTVTSVSVTWTGFTAGSNNGPANAICIVIADALSSTSANELTRINNPSSSGTLSWTGSSTTGEIFIIARTGLHTPYDGTDPGGQVTLTSVSFDYDVDGDPFYSLLVSDNALATTPTWTAYATGTPVTFPYRQVFDIGGGDYLLLGENGGIAIGNADGVDSRKGSISTSGTMVGSAGA